jgi:ectoine hydroxylase-related dioxygenase (phytanoyl-CoA dioxygenase family)
MKCINALIDHPLPLYLARAAGIRYPVAGTIPTIRIDRPGVTKYLTRPHQDFWYSLIADRSVVLWQPIIGLNRDMGLLGVVPGSHKEGFHPFEDEGAYTFAMRNDYPDHSYVECEIATDEILVFDQFLVHRSGDNNGKLPRVTMQLRYNDLEAMAEVVPTFTAVTSKAVVERQKRLLAGTVLPLPGARRSADA